MLSLIIMEFVVENGYPRDYLALTFIECLYLLQITMQR